MEVKNSNKGGFNESKVTRVPDSIIFSTDTITEKIGNPS